MMKLKRYDIPEYLDKLIDDCKSEQEKMDYKYQPLTYLVKSGDYVKIGKTTRFGLNGRVSAIQTGNPEKIGLVSYLVGDYESDLHTMFASYRHRGEWFFADKSIIDFFKTAENNRTRFPQLPKVK
ncbi:MAG: GIY-YIG nuclease family protein [Pirellulales bacterium]